MRLNDGRRLDRTILEFIHKNAIERYKKGEKAGEISKSFGMNRTTIYDWLNRYEEEGEAGLSIRPIPGREPKLTEEQQKKVGDLIIGKQPHDYGLNSSLWTRHLVSELIKQEFSIILKKTAVGEMLHRLGINPVKPVRVAAERNPEEIENWIEHTYPDIVKAAKRENAEILFMDEFGISSNSTIGRTWGVCGERTKINVPVRHETVSAVGAVDYHGAFWFDVYTGGMKAELFNSELDKLMRYRRRPLYLILDSLRAHTAKAVQEHVASFKGKLQLHFLPGYAPELNPSEYVWNYVKATGTKKNPLRTGEVLKGKVNTLLSELQADEKKVKSIVQPIVNSINLSVSLASL